MAGARLTARLFERASPAQILDVIPKLIVALTILQHNRTMKYNGVAPVRTGTKNKPPFVS